MFMIRYMYRTSIGVVIVKYTREILVQFAKAHMTSIIILA